MPYYGQHEITFPHVEGKNIYIFHGENSKGKTSITHALRWALYGKTEEKIDDRDQVVDLSKLINSDAERQGESDFSVSVEFEHQGDDFELIRKASLNTSTREWRTDDLLKKSGNPLSHSEALSTINSIAPYEAHKFFLFDGERLDSFKKLLSAEKGAAILIKDSIEDVLGIPALVGARDQFEGLIRKYTLAEKNAITTHAADTEAVRKNESLNAQREDLNNSIESLKTVIKENSEEISRIEQIATDNKDWIESINQEKELNQRIDGLDESKKNAQKEIKESRGNAWKSVMQSIVENKTKDQDRYLAEKMRLTDEYNQARIKIDLLEEFKQKGICPTCSREYQIQSQQLEELAQLKTQMDEVQSKIKVLPINNKWKRLDDDFRKASSIEDIAKLEESVIKIDLQMIKYGKEIQSLKKERGDIAVSEAELERNNSIRDQLIEDNGGNNTKLESLINELQKVNQELQRIKFGDVSGSNELVSKAQKRKLDAIALSEVFDSAIEILRRKLKDEVEEKATEAFRNLTNRPEDYDRLKITDSYGMHIIDKKGEIIPMRSAGAEQIVALSLITGLNLTGKSPGPLVIDTPFARLDVTHRLNIMEYLPSAATQFIVLVHSGEFDPDSHDAVLSKLRPKIAKEFKIRSISSFRSVIEE